MPKRKSKLRSGAGGKLPTSAEALVVTEDAIVEACQAGDLDQLRCWGRQGVRVTTCRPLFEAVLNGNLDVMRYLVLELGADVNEADIEDDEIVALHMAVYHGRPDVVRCLLNELKAEGNKMDSNGSTALFYAVVAGHLDVMRCLVREVGADINHTNNRGEIALMMAAKRKHSILTKWLVKAGANPQAKNAYQKNDADISRAAGASPEQTAYLEAKAHCAHPGSSGAGTKKCQGCMQGRYCGPACHVAHWPVHMAECRRLGAALKSAQEERDE
jgi:hypothetical protein